MKDIIVINPFLNFWVLGTVPTEDIKTTKTPEKIKILIDETLQEQLHNQHNRLHVEQCEQLMSDIHQQMVILNLHRLSVTYFEIDDIVIIGGKYYFINDKKIVKITNNHLIINKMYDTSLMFLPYDLNNEHSSIYLPLNIHPNSYMYSLALLTLYCLFNTPFKTRNEALGILNQIVSIELYWCISRCLETDSNKRKLLFI
jgi:hypothetical protein